MAKPQSERICYRFRTNFPVRYKRKGSEQAVRARGCDLSPAGIGFEAPELIPSDEILSVEFRLRGSFRKLKAEVEVVRSVQVGSAKKSYPYLTGTRIVKMDSKDVSFIGNYIVRHERFWGGRILVLVLGIVLALSVLLRAVNFFFLDYFGDTALGAEWSLRRIPEMQLALYGTFHVFFACWMLLCTGGVTLFKEWARKTLILLSLVGILIQILRLAFKTQMIYNDLQVLKTVLSAEGALCLMYLALFVILVRRRFTERFGLVYADSREHLDYKTEAESPHDHFIHGGRREPPEPPPPPKI